MNRTIFLMTRQFYDRICAFPIQYQNSSQEKNRHLSCLHLKSSNQSNTRRREEAVAFKFRQNKMQQKRKSDEQMQGNKKRRYFSASSSDFTQASAVSQPQVSTFKPLQPNFKNKSSFRKKISSFRGKLFPVNVHNFPNGICITKGKLLQNLTISEDK